MDTKATVREIDVTASYNKVLAGYVKLLSVLMGRAPLSSLGKDARVLWEPAGSRAAGDVLQLDMGSSRMPLWDLVIMSLVEGGFKLGRGFSTPHYLAFAFFVERWLRSLRSADANRLADLASYYRRWDGQTLYEQRFTRANGGLDSVVTLGVFGHSASFQRLGGWDEPLLVTMEEPWSVLPMLHPALYQAMLVEWKSDQDDADAVTPWIAWKRLFGDVAISSWMPLVVGSTEHWDGTDLRAAHLSNATLHSMDFRRADLRGARLVRAHLERSDMRNADLRGADLHEASLIRVNLAEANLSGANLEHAALDSANLRRANLRGADMTFAIARYATMDEADLSGVDLEMMDIKGATFHGARGIPYGMQRKQ